MHIGSKIKEVFDTRDLTLVDFAERIGTVRQNVYRIFERHDVDTDMLMKISAVLEHDFFQYFKPLGNQLSLLPPHDASANGTSENGVSANGIAKAKIPSTPEVPGTAAPPATSDCQRELDVARREIEYLKKIVFLLEERIEYLTEKKI